MSFVPPPSVFSVLSLSDQKGWKCWFYKKTCFLPFQHRLLVRTIKTRETGTHWLWLGLPNLKEWDKMEKYIKNFSIKLPCVLEKKLGSHRGTISIRGHWVEGRGAKRYFPRTSIFFLSCREVWSCSTSPVGWVSSTSCTSHTSPFKCPLPSVTGCGDLGTSEEGE